MSERLVGAAVEQTMADMLYLVENDGLVDRMIKNYSGSGWIHVDLHESPV